MFGRFFTLASKNPKTIETVASVVGSIAQAGLESAYEKHKQNHGQTFFSGNTASSIPRTITPKFGRRRR